MLRRVYKEGSYVTKGALLFEIDPRQFQAALDQAKGDLARNEAALAKARLDVERFTPLAAEKAISQEELDNAGSALRQAEANVASANAAVEHARLKNLRRAAVAQWEQARVQYQQSVTGAFAEVATALGAYARLAQSEDEQRPAVDAYREAVRLAKMRYVVGLSDYLEVLQALQQLYPAENALAETRFNRLATLVELYKALGGGWKLSDHNFAAPPPAPAGGG